METFKVTGNIAGGHDPELGSKSADHKVQGLLISGEFCLQIIVLVRVFGIGDFSG